MTELIITFVAIYLVAQAVLFVYNIFVIEKVSNDIRNKLASIIHEVKVEEQEGMNYWFDSDTDQFLGQGKTIQDAIDHVKARFPNHIFLLPEKGILSGPDWKLQDTFNVKEFVHHEK